MEISIFTTVATLLGELAVFIFGMNLMSEGLQKSVARVARPGGIVAAHDSVYSAKAWFPQPPALEHWREIYMATARANGGEVTFSA